MCNLSIADILFINLSHSCFLGSISVADCIDRESELFRSIRSAIFIAHVGESESLCLIFVLRVINSSEFAFWETVKALTSFHHVSVGFAHVCAAIWNSDDGGIGGVTH